MHGNSQVAKAFGRFHRRDGVHGLARQHLVDWSRRMRYQKLKTSLGVALGLTERPKLVRAQGLPNCELDLGPVD
jgi:hypothetical protein